MIDLNVATVTDQQQSSIDLTALMDVIFILLIFFMITAGVTQVATKVDLTKVEEKGTQQSSKGITIEILSPIDWKLGGKNFNSFKQVKEELALIYQSKPNQKFFLVPDKKLPAETLIQLMHFLVSKKITNVQIISQKKI